MEARIIISLVFAIFTLSCNNQAEVDIEMDSTYNNVDNAINDDSKSVNIDTISTNFSKDNSEEKKDLDYELESTSGAQNINRGVSEEDEEVNANNKKTNICLYCAKKIKEGSGVDDECNYVKDSNGRRINTGLNYILGIGPSFCSQYCFDKFHERKHDGHDIIL